MKIFLTILTSLGIFMALIGFKVGRDSVEKTIKVIQQRIYIPPAIDTLYDTVSVEIQNKPELSWTEEDVVLLVKYCKTQQSDINNDFWGVVQAMIHRCNHYKVNMRQYYARDRVNNSGTIRRIKQGHCNRNFTFTYESNQDRIRRKIVYLSLLDIIPDSVYLPPNVLYFESHPESWNSHRKGLWNRSNIYVKFEHEFYINPSIKTNGKNDTSKVTIALH